MFKNHLEMIGRNETASKKAKFWQSYIRSLKGSEDIRAQESPRTRAYRPLSFGGELPHHFRSIYDDLAAPAERISGPGYRYLPVHRETYGYSPRPIYTSNYRPSYEPRHYDPEKAWNDHLDRMAELERRYPSRYGLYLKDKPSFALGPLEYEPETKPSGNRASSVPPPSFRAGSVPPLRAGSPFRELSVPRGLRASSVDPLDNLLDNLRLPLYSTGRSPTPVKAGRWAPRPSEIAYDSDGLPIFTRGGLTPETFDRLRNPSPAMPLSAITRDPWWWDLGDLRPAYYPFNRSPSLLRDSFLSPVKRRYLWTKHPIRPFDDLLLDF
ncbi:uncharacterized protein LOC132258596 isoform X1 [Phlebotomus argentipes]|uniref:uncharacterized protein LOC132258596 isoform X1 n=1 Tax=Phlebotomus argentipes TaxID=94469 RepID=UPI0028930365|nr:uncharacterized protein LOC132258596 isoform X1 [Phlebotomus argentipes]XP_059611949.1 uncharacterized protein LOC132258596 isoform X1 [Phlebotomus argentipes]XP_059611950.1 uncharacterized protein LOC132258596 isoform X1 [Phlebotomus argentipes]